MSHLLIEEALNVLLAPNIGLIVRLEPRFMWDINDHFLAHSCPLGPTEVINSAAIETTEPISPIWRMNVYSPALGSAQQVSRSGLFRETLEEEEIFPLKSCYRLDPLSLSQRQSTFSPRIRRRCIDGILKYALTGPSSSLHPSLEISSHQKLQVVVYIFPLLFASKEGEIN